MNVYWKLTPEEAEELSGILYAVAKRKRCGKADAEAMLNFWASLSYYMREQKRSSAPGEAFHDCMTKLAVNDEQYQRLCALQDSACHEPEEKLADVLNVGLRHLLDRRFDAWERMFPPEADNGKEEETQ